jgi:HPt (histidine-containing phosphotransfer) domain-containing protein
VERAAHTLKGSSGNMGAARMAAVCAELEEAGASGDLGRALGLLARLEEELGRVRPALEAEAASEWGCADGEAGAERPTPASHLAGSLPLRPVCLLA